MTRGAAPPLLLLLLASGPALAAAPSKAEQAGRTLYETGESPSGAGVNVLVGGDASPLPGTALPCAGCHGADGRGRPEGGVRPPDLTWTELTKPYGHLHGARRHGPFDDRSLRRAITEGLDPAGNRLDAAMPRYSLSAADLAALLAWLKVLERQREPGVEERTVRLATLLPGGAGRLAEVGAAMQATLAGALAEVNAGGGLNGRRLLLEVVRFDPARGGGVRALERRLAERPALALLSPFAPGEEAALVALAERKRLPLIGPYGPFSPLEARFTFQPLPGLAELGPALLACAGSPHGPGLLDPPALILHQPGAAYAAAAQASLAQARRQGWTQVAVVEVPAAGLDAGSAQALGARGAALLLVLGEDPLLASVLRAFDGLGLHPWVLAPGTLAARAAAEAPAGFEGRLLLGYPSLPADETPAGQARLAEVTPAGSGDRHRVARTSALLATTVLLEGLVRAGGHPTRARLVEQLEGLSGFETGLSRPLSFGGQQRVGARGGYVVQVELAHRTFQPLGGWWGLE